MSTVSAYKRKLSAIARLWDEGDYGTALAEVEGLLEAWPGNDHLLILWASLVQLQDKPSHSLNEAKQALQQAIELNKSSPAGAIELGHFLDSVEDEPRAAAKAYADGVAAARQLLTEGLIGQAKALLQLGKRGDALRCLLEVLHLMQFQPSSKRGKPDGTKPDVIVGSPMGPFFTVQLEGPFAGQVEELLQEVMANGSASPLHHRKGMRPPNREAAGGLNGE